MCVSLKIHRQCACGAAVALCVLGMNLLGCSNVLQQPVHLSSGANVSIAAEAEMLPLLRLSPKWIEKAFSEQQQLIVTGPHGERRELQAMLEIDSAAVRLALVHWGGVLARLSWDGEQLDVQRSPHLPSDVQPERVLSDLQLSLWPLPAIEQALPKDWTVAITAEGARLLRYKEVDKVKVSALPEGLLELYYIDSGWKLQVKTAMAQHMHPLKGVNF